MIAKRKKLFLWFTAIVILFFLASLSFLSYVWAPKEMYEINLPSTNSVESHEPRQLPSRPPKPAIDFSAIDAVLEEMPLANIAFNVPKLMNLGNVTTINLLLGMQKTPEELKELIKAEGEKRGAEIRISPEMEARLTGVNFSIKAMTPEKQAVSKISNTEWKWEIKPESIGKHQLHLTLSAMLFVDGRSMTRSIRTFDETIDVEVTWKKQASDFFEKNWQWLWATLLVPLAGWIWAKKKKKEEIGI